jgi:hypothetical protein
VLLQRTIYYGDTLSHYRILWSGFCIFSHPAIFARSCRKISGVLRNLASRPFPFSRSQFLRCDLAESCWKTVFCPTSAAFSSNLHEALDRLPCHLSFWPRSSRRIIRQVSQICGHFTQIYLWSIFILLFRLDHQTISIPILNFQKQTFNYTK